MLFWGKLVQIIWCAYSVRPYYLDLIFIVDAFIDVSPTVCACVCATVRVEYLSIILSFHDGMIAMVVENGDFSPSFDVVNGTKQGCVLAPLLFIIFFSMMLLVAFKDCTAGIPIHYRTDGDVFDVRRLQAKTKVKLAILRDLLFADDCALVSHTMTDAQLLFSRFSDTAWRFGLTVSLKKTEVLHQPYPLHHTASATIIAGDTCLKSVEQFCYLGNTLVNTVSSDSDIILRLAKAGNAFGLLQRRLWSEHGVSVRTKVAVSCPHSYTVVKPGPSTGAPFESLISFISAVCNASLVSSGRTESPTPTSCAPARCQASRRSCCERSFDGPGMSYACRTTASRSRYSSVNLRQANVCKVGLFAHTKTH